MIPATQEEVFDNFLIKATTYDPQSYFGHNKMDLAFLCSPPPPFENESPGKEFFAEYHKIHPPQKNGFERRKLLYQLYHHLDKNHFYFLSSPDSRKESLTLMKKLGGQFIKLKTQTIKFYNSLNDNNRILKRFKPTTKKSRFRKPPINLCYCWSWLWKN